MSRNRTNGYIHGTSFQTLNPTTRQCRIIRHSTLSATTNYPLKTEQQWKLTLHIPTVILQFGSDALLCTLEILHEFQFNTTAKSM
jgi:hypothetical protein